MLKCLSRIESTTTELFLNLKRISRLVSLDRFTFDPRLTTHTRNSTYVRQLLSVRVHDRGVDLLVASDCRPISARRRFPFATKTQIALAQSGNSPAFLLLWPTASRASIPRNTYF